MEDENEGLIGSMDGGCSCGAASLGIFTYVFVFFMSVGVSVCARAFDAFAASLFVAGLPASRPAAVICRGGRDAIGTQHSVVVMVVAVVVTVVEKPASPRCRRLAEPAVSCGDLSERRHRHFEPTDRGWGICSCPIKDQRCIVAAGVIAPVLHFAMTPLATATATATAKRRVAAAARSSRFDNYMLPPSKP